jgi:hypothetical protein
MMGEERHTMKNGISKSLAQEVLSVVTETIVDAYALMLSISPNDVRKDDMRLDVKYVEGRFRSEGLTFLTVTLPRLGEWFDRYVCGEQLERVVGFAPYNGLFPVFLRPVWKICGILNAARLTGQNESVNPAIYDLVRIVRTILHGLKKLEVPFSDEQKMEKLRTFFTIEDELRTYPIYSSPGLWRAQFLLEGFLEGYVPTCDSPRHGPGAVAGGERGNEKWNFSTLYASLHREWPYWDYHFGMKSGVRNPNGFIHEVKHYPIQLAANALRYASMKRVDEPTARMLFVPKDSRGPRIISCEPKELMYIQQGVARHLMKYIENHSYTRGHVNFVDQEINGNLALEASASKDWATIDLSDASDRVGCALTDYIFPMEVTRKWNALRSTATLLENGTKVPLVKFAPMGSAMCFPVESLTFWALVVGCVWEHTNDLALALSSVYVYGDDIIVRNAYYLEATKALSSVGLKVNSSKSFCGEYPFRESCGIDGLDGHNVTPLRLRKFPPQRPSDGQAIAAYVKYVELSTQLMPHRSAMMLKYVERLVGRIPRTPIPQSYLSIVDPFNYWSLEDFSDVKWNPSSCYWEARLLTIKNRKRVDPIDSWSRLQDAVITRPEGDPSLVVDRSSTLIRKKVCNITYLSW